MGGEFTKGAEEDQKEKESSTGGDSERAKKNGVSPKRSNDKSKRKDDKNEKIVILAKDKPKHSSEKKVLELIQKNNKEKKDHELINNVISNHFFMQDLNKQAREEIISTMSLCKVKAGTTLYQEGAYGSYWFIVNEGTFDFYKDNKYQKSYEKGTSFGELALMNNEAVRDGTMKAKTDCIVWVLKREAFRKVINFLSQMNFDENMKFLSGLTLPIDKDFKTLLANNMLQQFYKTGEYIIKTGEEGNCLFIIKSGEVKCMVGEKVIRVLSKGDNFGQKAILHGGKRTLDVVAKTDCVLCSISVDFFKTQIGENYKEALYFSYVALAFQSSKVFNKVTEKMLMKLHKYFVIKNFGFGELIFKKGEKISNKLTVVLEGNIFDKTANKIMAKRGEILYETEMSENKEIAPKNDLLAEPDCLVCFIDYSAFQKELGGSLSSINSQSKVEASFKNINLFRNLSDDKVELLQSKLKVEKYENGKRIIVQGETGDKFYIIKSGRVDFFVNSKYVRSLGENEEFGARALVLTEKRSATAISNGKVEVYTLNSADFNSILAKNLADYFKKKFMMEDTSVELKDLDAIQELGRGNFGFVYLVKNRKNKCQYAIKALSLKQIKKEKLEPCVELERNVLLKIDHPFIMKMVKYLKNENYIFFLNEYIHGKELWEVIRDIGLLNKDQTQFYIGGILLAIEYLHKKKIIYRDLKPENVMIGEDGFPKIIDFGTVKEVEKNRVTTVIGTPHYMAPEIVKGEGYSFQVDVWSIAVCMYEFFCGKLPFGEDCEEPMDVYKAVAKEDLVFPSFVTDINFINLMIKLLKKNPLNRLTKISKIKEDPYWNNFDWGKLISFELKPPYQLTFKKDNKKPLNVPYLTILKNMPGDKAKDPKKKASVRQLEFEKWVKNF